MLTNGYNNAILRDFIFLCRNVLIVSYLGDNIQRGIAFLFFKVFVYPEHLPKILQTSVFGSLFFSFDKSEALPKSFREHSCAAAGGFRVAGI